MYIEPYRPEWPARYEQERARVLAELGRVPDGGIVDTVAHVGSSIIVAFDMSFTLCEDFYSFWF